MQGTATSLMLSVLTGWLRAYFGYGHKNISIAVTYQETVPNKTNQINI